MNILRWAGASWLCIAALTGPAYAQSSPAADEGRQGIEDIVVTAERRVSSVQTTPIAISAVTGDALQSQQITNIESLTTRLPNISFSRSGGDARVFIRGIGLDSIAPGSDPRVAIYTDGAYNPRVQAALGSFFDIERVEVLSGPQGTLYGRNATAGAVNIISRDPGDAVNGYGRLTAGNYSAIRTEGAIGAPLSDSVGVRLAFQTSDRSGFGKNIVTGGDVDDERTRAVRAKLKYDGGAFKATLQGDYFLEDDNTGGYHIFGPAPGQVLFATTLGGQYPANGRDYAGPGPFTKIEAYGATGTLEYDLGGLTLTSISAYKHLMSNTQTTPDASTLGDRLGRLDILDKSDSFTQEVRLGGKIGILDLVVGAYYFHEKNFAGNDAGLNRVYFTGEDFFADGAVNRGTQKTDAYALFTQNTINLTDQLGVDIGARYSYEKRSVRTINRFNLVDPYNPAVRYAPNPADMSFQETRSWSSFDPKVGIHFKASRDLYLYASYSSGFKSGGFNVAFIQPSFDPEEIEDFEAGVKADLFDRRLRVNLASFYYKYKNLQVNTVGGELNNQLVTENAARAKLYGLELNMIARPVDDLQINFDAAYLKSKFQDYTTRDPSGLYIGVPLPDGTPPNADGTYSLTGHPLTYAPKWKLHGALAYTFHSGALDIAPRVDATYTSRVYHSAFKLPYLGQKAYTLVDLYLDFDLADQGLTASFFMKNATKKYYLVASTIGASFFGFPLTGLTGAPRTFGVSISKTF
ncbi:MAG: TonB-dependent receptor [Sphingobium phenoxybenzoativorans]